jgi:predicted transposase YdaD
LIWSLWVQDKIIEARQEGRQEGLQEGFKLSAHILKLLRKGKTPGEISTESQIPYEDVLAVQKEFEDD